MSSMAPSSRSRSHSASTTCRSHGAPPGSASYSYGLPYTIYYNDAGNFPPNVYDPDNASQYGFVTDAFDPHTGQHTQGTASFSFEGDPMWPNFGKCSRSLCVFFPGSLKEAVAQCTPPGRTTPAT